MMLHISVASCYTGYMTEETMKALEKITKRIPRLLEERDQRIVEAKRDGHSVVDIARAAQLSRAQVHRILAWAREDVSEADADAILEEDMKSTDPIVRLSAKLSKFPGLAEEMDRNRKAKDQ